MLNNERRIDLIKLITLQNETPTPYEEKVNRLGWIDYGVDNLYPQYLIDLMDKSAKHNAIIKGKAQMIGGNGFKMENLSDSAKIFLRNNWGNGSLEQLLSKWSYDLALFGGFFPNVIWSRDKKTIASLNYIPYERVRMAAKGSNPEIPQLDYYYVCEDWSNHRKFARTLYQGFSSKVKQDTSQIEYVRDYRPGSFIYSKPDYIAIENWIKSDYEIAVFHLNSITNSFNPSMHITFCEGIPTPEEMDKVVKKLKSEYGGALNTGKPIFSFASDKDKAPILTPIESNNSDEKFSDLVKTIEEYIYQGHGVTNPVLFGVKTAGELGNTNELIEALKTFQSKYIAPKQRIIEQFINRLARINGISDKIEIEPYKLEMDVKVNVADILSILQSEISYEQKIQVLQTVGYNNEDAKRLVGQPTQNINPNNGLQ